MMATKPQTIGFGLSDSPVGLAAFLYDYNGGEPGRALSKDDMLDDVTLYWVTNSAASAARIYWENKGRNLLIASVQKTSEVAVPVALSIFPNEIYAAPESWARRAFKDVIYHHKLDGGGILRLGKSRRSSPRKCVPHSESCAHRERHSRRALRPRRLDLLGCLASGTSRSHASHLHRLAESAVQV